MSGRQARVYLATLKLGGGKVQSIAELSKVSRQEIYRLIGGLQELGLMQRNLTNPTTYTATPISQAAKMLLQQKTIELSSLTQQTKQLTKKLSQNNPIVPASVDLRPCFGAIFESDRGKKYQQILSATEHSINAVLSWRRFKQLNIYFESQLQTALKKGVTIKIITEKPANHHLPKWIKPAQEQYPNFSLKTQQTPVTVVVTIFDQKVADIAFNPNSSLTKGPDLWTATQSITALCKEYFTAVWNRTKKYSKIN